MSQFEFKYFTIQQDRSAMKVGTDAILLGCLLHAHHNRVFNRILDVGTGTGVIGLILAQRFSEATIDGIDIDQDSIADAEINFSRSMWSDRLNANSSSLSNWSPEYSYDLIVSNPPYYTSNNPGENVRRAAARHVHSLPINEFALHSSRLIDPSGELWVIVPHVDKEHWVKELVDQGFFLFFEVQIIGRSGREPIRSILGFSRVQHGYTSASFTVRGEDGQYTEAYLELTKEFHGKDLRKKD